MAAERPDRPSFFDTLTGFDFDEDDDRLMRALEGVEHALDERGAALDELRRKSEPPPSLPPVSSGAPMTA